MTKQVSQIDESSALDLLRRKNVEYAQTWRRNHPEKLRRTVECGCGSTFLYTNKTHHIRSKKHTNWVNTNQMLGEIEMLKRQLATSN